MGKEVRKLNDKGEVIQTYSSITAAEIDNGICPQTLHSYIKRESPCKGYYYECDGVVPCYGEWDGKRKRRSGLSNCPFEETLQYFAGILPYKWRRPCKSYMRRVMLHNGRKPDEAFLNYYLTKMPSDVYVSSDGIIELVSQWRNLQQTKSPTPTDSLKSDSSRSTDGA